MLQLILSVVLSVLFPGAGHYYLGHRAWCFAFLGTAGCLLLFGRYLGVDDHYTGFLIFVSACFALYFVVIVHSAWLAWRKPAQRDIRAPWFIAIVVLLFAGLVPLLDIHFLQTYIALFVAVYIYIILHMIWCLFCSLGKMDHQRHDWLVILVTAGLIYSLANAELPWQRFFVNGRMNWMGYGPFRIPSISMLPGLRVGDFFMVNTRYYDNHSIERGDVVVFWSDKKHSTAYIKRAVAKAGDRVRINNGQLIVNDNPVAEPYVLDDNRQQEKSRHMAELEVEANHLFVLGDNRDNSNDSRFWGQVNGDDIVGIARYIWFSYNFKSQRLNRERLGLEIK